MLENQGGHLGEYRRSNSPDDNNDSITNDDDIDKNSTSISGNPNRKQLEEATKLYKRTLLYFDIKNLD